MPISGIKSYAETMQQFMDHWTRVNTQLGTHPLLLPGAYTIADFTDLRTMIVDGNDAISAAQTQATEKRDTLHTQKKTMLAELELFRNTVRGVIPDSFYAAGLPLLPKVGAVQSRFLTPFAQAADIWSRINAHPPTGFTPPLMLPDDIQLLEFNAMRTNLATAYNDVIAAASAVTNAQKQRDANLPLARTWMKQYRYAVLSRLAPGDPLLDSIPRYSPVKGATPKAVTNLAFTYNPVTNGVHLTFTPSVSKNITGYALRYSPGKKYNPNAETTVATLPVTGPFVFDFTLSMVLPDAVGLFKVYVFNETGNHRASKVFGIQRSAATGLTLTSATDTTLAKAA